MVCGKGPLLDKLLTGVDSIFRFSLGKKREVVAMPGKPRGESVWLFEIFASQNIFTYVDSSTKLHPYGF